MRQIRREIIWDEISSGQWMKLYMDRRIMTDIMMHIFSILYRAVGHADHAKNIAGIMGTDYRALNAAVGWAGRKIMGKLNQTENRPPWTYVVNGCSVDGDYDLWVMKPQAVTAWKEMEQGGAFGSADILQYLAEDEASSGPQTNLFSLSHAATVHRIRCFLQNRTAMSRGLFASVPCCAVCGLERPSLLYPVPYHMGSLKKGLLFCPNHGALFAAHLITFSDAGKLLLSPCLTKEDKTVLHLKEGTSSHVRFNHRAMAVHRKQLIKNDREA
jgi:hypothetical protein